jgi:hypothetical protein
MMKMYRQGDVLLVAVPRAKAKAIKAGKDLRELRNGKPAVVLAHGEVTGHAHVVLSGKETGRGKGSVEFFEGHDVAGAAAILQVKGRAAELRHDEHSTIVLPRGTYRVIRQREYSPEAIRTVAD